MFRSYYWTSAGSYSHNKSFMEFDLSGLPQNAVITDAKLTLYGKNHYESQSTENSFYVSRNLGPWLENSITYSNMPDASTVEIIPMDATPDEEGAYQQNVEIPMTEWVSNWHTGIWGNFGFQLNLQNLGPYRSIHFYSSDASVDIVRPKLVVRYEIPARVYCSEATTSLIVSGLNSYTWSPTIGLSCTNCSSPTITINDEVQYFVGGYGSNGCPTKYSFDVFRCDEAYAELANAVNNEYYKVKDGCLYFKFNEEYTVGSSNNLDYSFYELNGGIKTPLNLGVKLVQKGLNYYYFNLKGQLTDGAYYLLEVSNSQKEKQYLKFKL